jgi:seryl-tRNA synthetase
MLDLKLIRSDPNEVRAAIARRGIDAPIDRVLELDEQRRAAQTRADELRKEQKEQSKEVPRLKGGDREKAIARAKELSDEIAELEREESALAAELRALLLEIPNLPHHSAPDGQTDEDNLVLHHWREPRRFDFEPRDHLDLGTALGIIDAESAARTSGSRFAYLKREGAVLSMAMARFALDRVRARGFTVVIPPVLVRREAMEGTGFLPTDEAQIYRIADDELYLAGTSEVPLAALHMDEILDPNVLPVRYTAFSTCFRREAGAHGRDVRGIFRVHQFDKVEMFSFVHPDESWQEHERIIEIEEEILEELELPYQTVNVCTGELGAPASKKIDLEAWFPGQQRYREVTSCSNTTDYQARRLSCRFRTEQGTSFVHTLNGTAIAGRHLAAILENYQESDGSVGIPTALWPYCGFERIGPP